MDAAAAGHARPTGQLEALFRREEEHCPAADRGSQAVLGKVSVAHKGGQPCKNMGTQKVVTGHWSSS